VQGARAGRHRWRSVGAEQRQHKHISQIQADHQQAGQQRALVHVADRDAELVGQHNQNDGWRYDLRQRAGGGDDAGCQSLVVTVAQHHRQRDQAHGNDRCGDHAGGGGEQAADQNHRVGKTAAHRAEQLADGVEQVFGHAGAFEDQAHEGEEGNCQQRGIGNNAVDALRQGLHQ